MSSTVLLTTWIGRPGASTPGTSLLMVAGKHFLFEDDQRKSTKYDMQKTVNFLDYIPMKTWTVKVKLLLYKALCHIQYNLMKKCGNPCAQLTIALAFFLLHWLMNILFTRCTETLFCVKYVIAQQHVRSPSSSHRAGQERRRLRPSLPQLSCPGISAIL